MRSMFSFLSILLAVLVIGWLTVHGLKSFTGGSADLKTGIAAKGKSERLACRTNIRQLNQFIRYYQSTHPGEPVTMENLEKAGMTLPECPAGGTYRVENNRIVCSIHGE